MSKNKTRGRALSPLKREAIIDAALSAFLELGYGATSMDEIVKRAGGSKATIYKHFKDKEDLFATVIDRLVRHHFSEELVLDDPPREALLAFAERRLQVVLTKEHNALRRLIVGEGARFPHIAETYYSLGPERSHRQLARYLREEDKRGTLRVDDPQSAAELFRSMLMHSPYLTSLFRPGKQIPARKLKEHARRVVEAFLKLYGPEPGR